MKIVILEPLAISDEVLNKYITQFTVAGHEESSPEMVN
jgi:hypothetical protein